MTNIQESENKCIHCGSIFKRASTIERHICEQKSRWIDRDNAPNRIAFNAWVYFYTIHHPNKKSLTINDFIKSIYYREFLKFGFYCIEANVLEPKIYLKYLLKNKISIARWNNDSVYSSYIIEYLLTEDCMDAVKRTVNNLIDVSNEENIELQDFFKFINFNKICYMISKGKISPWVLYNSETGKQFLLELNSDHRNLIFDYIHPEKYNIKFKRDMSLVKEVKQILSSIPL